MTIGARPIAVTELMLSSVGAKAVLAMSSQTRVMILPPIKQAGIMIIGFAVFNNPLIICGTAIPTNDIGPAKAVTVADNRLETSISKILKARISTPILRA
jgi:hypothetical protein